MTESEVYKLLKNDSGVNAIVGGRVYPLVAPQNAVKPFIVYRVVSGIKIQCMGGEIFKGDYRIQLDCYGITYQSVKSVGQAVKSSLIGFMNSNNIDMLDDYEDEAQLFKQIIDFKITDKD